MKIENLTQDEVVQLQTLLNKLNPVEVKPVDPLTTMVDDILNEFDFEKILKRRFSHKYISNLFI